MKKYDFGGYATKNNLRCTDGRTIRENAFKDCDGVRVPLVYMHDHKDVHSVLGHADLENRKDGVYAYCEFNDTENGKAAKEMVRHGDIRSLSIFANNLVQKGNDVIHGAIKEVSLVLAGANPGAVIDNLCIEHSDGSSMRVDEEAWITTGIENLDYTEEDMMKYSNEALSHADEEKEENGKTIEEVFNSMTEEQKNAVYAIIGGILEDAKETEDEEVKHFDEGGEDMKYNIFEGSQKEDNNTLSHAEMMEFGSVVLTDAKKYGTVKESFLAHAAEYGIDNIDYLFPDARTINPTPDYIMRDQTWVSDVMNGTHHTPFSRVKSIHADITAAEARARGYVKGNRKLEEVFTLLKRSTDPQTIYKKQKLDRDDVIDITDLDVVAWIKGEMRMMLNEEIARAILIGDGRNPASDDKIQENHVRPIYSDDSLYSVKVAVPVTAGMTDEAKAKAFIKQAIKSRKNYKGSGSPKMYIGEDLLADLRLIEDGIGHLMYDTMDKLATALNVSKIIPVPVMDGIYRTNDGTRYDLGAIIVNLSDYNVGADKGGAVSMFEDFDIDYNQMKYLIETRISGALVKPFSAMVIEFTSAAASPDPEDDGEDDGTDDNAQG